MRAMRSIFLDQHDSSKSASCLRVAYLAPASLEGRKEVTNAEAAAQPLYHKALAHLDDGEETAANTIFQRLAADKQAKFSNVFDVLIQRQ